MLARFAGIESDFDRNALNHFHIISSGIFRRQQASDRTACSSNALHVTLISFAVRVNINVGGLADLHVPQLCFLEVRRDPNVVKIDDFHHLLPNGNVLPHFDGAVGDDATYWRDDLGVLQIELRLIKRGLLGQNLRLRRISASANCCNLLGRSLG